jgi:hypothetical protein
MENPGQNQSPRIRLTKTRGQIQHRTLNQCGAPCDVDKIIYFRVSFLTLLQFEFSSKHP